MRALRLMAASGAESGRGARAADQGSQERRPCSYQDRDLRRRPHPLLGLRARVRMGHHDGPRVRGRSQRESGPRCQPDKAGRPRGLLVDDVVRRVLGLPSRDAAAMREAGPLRFLRALIPAWTAARRSRCSSPTPTAIYGYCPPEYPTKPASSWPTSCRPPIAGVERADVKLGDTVVVVGCGPVGLMSILTARLTAGQSDRGGHGPGALEQAKAMGAIPVDASAQDAVAAVMELTGGRGAEVVIECAGGVPALTSAMQMARVRGTVSVIGAHFEPDFPLDAGAMFAKETNLDLLHRRPHRRQGEGARPYPARDGSTRCRRSRTACRSMTLPKPTRCSRRAKPRRSS